MKFNFRLLTILTIITSVITLLAFTQSPSVVNKAGTNNQDTSSPVNVLRIESPNVHPGKQVFSFFDSSVNYRVYLPEEYSSTRHRYPVLYLLNGPVFSPDSVTHEDWMVDELLDSLGNLGRQKTIVIGFTDIKVGPDQYDSLCRFLATSVKPFIDENYRTQPLNSVIAGTGHYADAALLTSLLFKQQFPKAGVFSPTDSVNALVKSFGINGAGYSGRVFIYKNGSKPAGTLADNLAANSSALLYTRDKQHAKRAVTPFGGWFTEFYGWMMGNGFNYIINTKN